MKETLTSPLKAALQVVLYPFYEKRLLREIAGAKQPSHVAIMCDGNRRWAREAGFADVTHGHRVGAKKVGEMVRWCKDTDVELVTVYLLSTENLGRASDELDMLFDIIGDVVDELAAPETNCRLRLVGHLDLLPPEVAERMNYAQEKTAHDTGVAVNVAVGYGGRQEIVDAVRELISGEVESGTEPEKIADKVTVESISKHLYTSGQPDPDLVIRTSGEQRLSGFLLWQAAYSEIWFTDTYWPAFRRVDFLRALREYSKRSRRFGK
ncbi:isoprenyl transferase [Corynebacterium pseudotuberculosis]|uniref:isoprenyl transferase n=1 Tax=Corynebacterium pseudotuberculosis TaxID=1719 RepID=UPI0007193009|nr:isoprenyl transferase [Corynebacterium pseudotuberculosis]ALP34576.1 Undecaprenyl pyrophosphate synthase 1 [Corynebacterium pseudotuberculosis]ALR33356.1 undecaprenyl pyrophosphate synthase 1 [Corynebacterium pseudotuberculosis]APX35842.1 isoprenyl transferase [Corynebacterium pseudotuberculosis]AQL50838.1 Undecaprenyl diphosphate synthase [Corynebacterium pseudotuberculosis]ATQ65056.1 Undecaprenyl pyrophosphate synthase 1 [Corynebacterium pseudotuberculosis]